MCRLFIYFIPLALSTGSSFVNLQRGVVSQQMGRPRQEEERVNWHKRIVSLNFAQSVKAQAYISREMNWKNQAVLFQRLVGTSFF